VEQAWENKEARKKMNAIAQKGLSSMKQRLRKARAPFEKDLEAFRAAPWETEDSADERAVSETESEEDEGEDEGAEEAEEDDDGFKVVGKKGRKGKKGTGFFARCGCVRWQRRRAHAAFCRSARAGDG